MRALLSVSDKTGIRTIEADYEKGFFLNGKYLDIRAVNIHQDNKNGWAMTANDHMNDYLMIKDMGCTGVRMAHYQHDRY